MKRNFLSKFLLAAGLVAAATQVEAQVPLQGGTIATNIVTARFLVNAPVAIKGLKKISLATWGGQPNTAIVNAPVAKGLDSLAALPLTNPSAVAGKFCLLYRGGGISFAQKALYAQNAGATGVIIVNNIPGDPIAMGNTGTATITIPVVMLTDVDGNAMNDQLRNSVQTTITLGRWNIGGAHDLGILKGYAAMPGALNIPLSMWSNSNNVQAYKNWIGGAVGNYGTSTETNVTVTDSIVWVPTSGAATLAKTHSYSIASIAPVDSFKFGFGPGSASYYLTPQAGTGRYDYYSRLSYGQTDGAPEDNVNMFSQYVNDSIFCKGGYDYVKGEPRVSIGIQPASATNPFAMGPMFFSTRGGFAARAVQFYVSKNTVATLDGTTASILIYKWRDGVQATAATAAAALDSVVATNELELVGFGSKNFTSNDSVGKVYSMVPENFDNPNLLMRLDSNAWYWIAVQLQPDCFIGMDKATSYYTRALVADFNGVPDYPESAFFNDIDAAVPGAATLVFNFPFSGNAARIDSSFFDRYNEIPAVALKINKTVPTSVISPTHVNIGNVGLYPNPSTTGFINVAVNLEKQSALVNYRLVDNMGRLIADYKHNNVKEENFKISTAGMASGIYYLIVDNGDGSLIRKFTVN